jgi:hypothetical protein
LERELKVEKKIEVSWVQILHTLNTR